MNTAIAGSVSGRRLSVAPMLAWTDRFERRFLRLITRKSLLYTEMIAAQALARGRALWLLDHRPDERPLAVQLGGFEPELLAEAARLAEASGIDEINLNVGCPSDRVNAGRFGACLMLDPPLVAACVSAMCRAVSVPVTVKHRIGVDDRTAYADLRDFVARVADAGCRTFIVHARIARLKGLSPKQNREIPPLVPETVHRLKDDFPGLEIVINGGIRDLATAMGHLAHLDGVMIGRAAYETPMILAEADSRIFGEATEPPTLEEIVAGLADLAGETAAEGEPLHRLTRHVLGLFHGRAGARIWRRIVGEEARRDRWQGSRAPDLIRLARARVADAEAAHPPKNRGQTATNPP